ncbi:hypothetical protein CR513_24007, partial [Mucuna pruriens]
MDSDSSKFESSPINDFDTSYECSPDEKGNLLIVRRLMNLQGPKTISVETETRCVSTNRRHLSQLKPRPRSSLRHPGQYNRDQMYIDQLKSRSKASWH